MTTQTMPRILALAPRGSGGLGVVAAACRAKALGIIDLCADPDADVEGLSADISRLTSQPFGLRVTATEVQRPASLWQEVKGLAAVCVVLGAGDDPEPLGERVQAIEHPGRIAIAEVTTRQGIRQAIRAGFSALIVAGNEAQGAIVLESSLDLLQGALAEGNVPVWVRGGIGPAAAAACVAAGAAGVVLDGALLLARESPLDETDRQCLPVGPDAALAEQLARKYVTVGGIVHAVEQAMDEGQIRDGETADRSQPSDVAIVGMAAIFPGATSVGKFWANTLRGIDSIIEVPADHWDWRLYYDPDPKAPDKIVSKWGGFVPDVPFDPLRYGMPPSSLPSIEPAQMLALEVVRTALADAGYAERPFPRERTGVVLGMGGGAAQLAMGYAFRSYLPMLNTVVPEAGKKAIEACKGLLPEWTEDSFPGFLLNVTAGRIANRLNLGGANYTVDAACGSSLAAASLAVRELETGSADVVILGGVNTVQNPFTYLAFSKTQAFSHRGRCRPFDVGADGIVISEGAAAVVLKRLADAERDGDRIYAVIKGVGASSDGRQRGLTAPVVDGQLRALSRAYAKSAVSPASVGYVEAHGTGTALGDVVEVEALGKIFRDAGAEQRQCVVGSVKSLIGHTKCAAGLAGLINTSLALYHKVYPPTIGIETPNPKLDLRDGPFRLCTRAQPWLHAHPDRPRRAGVSAFGFGGTNFHAVLEEYDRNIGVKADATIQDWPLELFVWQAEEPGQIVPQLDELAAALSAGARPTLGDLAHTLISAREDLAARSDLGKFATLAILAGSHDELSESLRQARTAIAHGRSSLDDPRGILFAAQPAWAGEPVAFVFPGQGSQSPGMLQELAVLFPEVRGAFDEFDREIAKARGRLIGPLVFPPPAFDAATREEARVALMETDVAQPAVGAASVGLLRLLRAMGLEPSVMAGHSYGELVALHAAGVLDAPALALLSQARGRLMREVSGDLSGSMAALITGALQVEKLANEVPDVRVANWNSPSQTVIAGPTVAVKQAVELAASRGIQGRMLPVSRAFHTPMVAAAREPLARLAESLLDRGPDRPVYSNLDGLPHPSDRSAIASRLGDHLALPVRFADMIAAMYRDGARVFVEVGPGSVLTTLVNSNLAQDPHLAISCDVAGSSSLRSWLRAIARLVTAGVPLRLERLTRGRGRRVLDLHHLPQVEGSDNWTPSTWLVNGSRARPAAEPERRRLGMGPALPPPQAEPPRPAAPPQASAPRPIVSSGFNMAAVGSGEQSNGAKKPVWIEPPRRNGKLDSHTNMKPRSTPPISSNRVIESFQQTMQAFLEVQRATMLAYLTGRGPARAPGATGAGPDVSEKIDARGPGAGRFAAPFRRDDLPERGGLRPAPAGTHPHATLEASDPAGHLETSSGPPPNGQSHAPVPATGRAGGHDGRSRVAPGITTPAPTVAAAVAIAPRPLPWRPRPLPPSPPAIIPIRTRSRPDCSRSSAIGRATRSRPWALIWTWRPIWVSTRSSVSRFSASCATSFPV